jgi:hypothetical protein
LPAALPAIRAVAISCGVIRLTVTSDAGTAPRVQDRPPDIKAARNGEAGHAFVTVCFGLGRPASHILARWRKDGVERSFSTVGKQPERLINQGAAIATRSSPASATVSSAEPLLSYELDRIFRSPRRPPNVDLRSDRAEAGRILLTSSGHDGVSSDDRAYLVQLVGSTTALSPANAERPVDNGTANAKAALNRSRRSTIILAFSLATALLLGAVAAWAAACFGGRHRDGAPLPDWMVQSNRLARRRIVIE